MQTDRYGVKYSKAQMKIQQMAFMLVAVMIFFAMVALVYFIISISSLQESAEQLREEEAQEIARQLSGTPELAFTAGSDCAVCIDFDKAFALSQLPADYGKKLWNLDFLMIEKIYPTPSEAQCTASNYPDCKNITIINLPPGRGLSGPKTAFVALVRWDDTMNGYAGGYRYEFGIIHALPKNLEN